ncbi:MAG: hypothetical protein WD512_13150 [Candidatus Paceibacterota bacterium]
MYISKEFYNKLLEIENNFASRLLFGTDFPKTPQKKTEDLYLAIIIADNSEQLSFVTKDEKVAYKLDGYERTKSKWDKFSFVRWARPMDI